MIPRKLMPGEKIDFTALSQNEQVDAIQDLRNRENGKVNELKTGYPRSLGNEVYVKNLGWKDVPWYGILELGLPRVFDGELDVDGFKSKIYLKGTPPGESWFGETYCIAQEEIKVDSVGRCLIQGMSQVRILYTSDEQFDYQFAIPTPGEVLYLTPVPSGPITIYWSEKLLGLSWALVLSTGMKETEFIGEYELYKKKTQEDVVTEGYQRIWDGKNWVTIENPALLIELHDHLELFRGRGRGDFEEPYDTGSRGRYFYNRVSQKFEILDMEPHTTWIIGTVEGTVDCEDETFKITPVAEKCFPVGSIITDSDPAEPIVVENYFHLAGENGSPACAWWNEHKDAWQGMILDLIKVEAVVDIRYDEETHELQKKSDRILVLHREDVLAPPEGDKPMVSDWIVWHQAVEIAPIDDLQVDSLMIQTKDMSAYVLERGIDAGWVNKIGGTECEEE